MKKNEPISITDSLLIAHINKELNQSDTDRVKLWLAESDNNIHYFEKVQKTWQLSGSLSPNPVFVNTDLAWDSVLNKINQPKDISVKKPKVIQLKKWLSIAAILAVISISYFTWKNSVIDLQSYTATTEKINTVLDDGSTIVLNKNTSLQVLSNFDKTERHVKLEGEAFFNIERDTTKPFIIDLNNQTYVKVLGTSFNINTSQNKTTVYVKTGTVEFGDNTNKLLLTAGQKAYFDSDTKQFKRVEETNALQQDTYWINKQLTFKGENLESIIETLSKVFNQKIILNCESAKKYPIVSSHHSESIDDILNVICGVHNLNLIIEEKPVKTYILECNE